MCGIAGLLSSREINSQLLLRMGDAIAHRGPDDSGFWINSDPDVGFVHRRLSIVDLSPHGHQPMHSADRRFVLDYNGEIYNHAHIRNELEANGVAPRLGWRGHSDTETLLQAIAVWGLESTLAKVVGMFSFALWDNQDRVLRLVRDRFGEKPLYYGWVGRDFVFSSELKALRVHPEFDNPVDRRALTLFVARTYVPAPYSIFRRIFKVPPACILTVPADAALVPLDEPPVEGRRTGLRLDQYWSYRAVVRNGLAEPISHDADAIAELDHALTRAVSDQSTADVPVGMFLSGGIDSSTIAAYYQRNSSRPIRTFSIGFEDSHYNEAPFAHRVAEKLGTVHHERIVTEKDALDVIPLLPRMYDEPFGDSSQIPTYLVSRLARSEVTVALTGDGGDELFGGYYRHFYTPRLWRHIRRLPRPVRTLGMPLSRVPAHLWSRAAGILSGHGRSNLGLKIQKGLRVASSARSIDDVYESFLDEWSFGSLPVLGGGDHFGCDLNVAAGAPDEVRIMYCDAVTYLPDDILCKVDRAAMAVSLETRVPFLDHRVAEVAARIPINLKIAGADGKKILRKLLYRQAPRELFDRPKAGFAIPIGNWLKGPLRSWAEELLDERRLTQDGWFDAAAVRSRWHDHLTGRRDSPPAIWAILMFQAWLDEQRRPAAAAA
jgi:asparagine synthase (glutamine-hydrolysing)